MPDVRKPESTHFGGTLARIPEYVKLQAQQLLKLQSEAGSLQLIIVARTMYGCQCIGFGHESQTCHHIGGKRFRHIPAIGRYQCLRHGIYGSRGYPPVTQFLCQRIHPSETARTLHRLGSINLGMHHTPAARKFRRLAEQYILHTCPVILTHPLYPLEPYHLHRCRSVGKQSHQTHFGALALHRKVHETSAYLHHRHVARE